MESSVESYVFNYIGYLDKGRVYPLQLYKVFYRIREGYLHEQFNTLIKQQRFDLAGSMRDVVQIPLN